MTRTYTTAPVDYDGFGTQTIRIAGKDQRGRDIRLVETPAEHAEWQRRRYHSGAVFLVADEVDFAKLVSYGFATETP